MDFEKARECAENQEVMRIASQRFKIPKEDKNQCKLLGLWDAVNMFDYRHGVPFKPFLSLRVKFRCLKYCNENYNSRMQYIDTTSTAVMNIDEKSQRLPNFATDVLLSLKGDEKDIITKRFIENRTLGDIGEEYGVSYETIRKRINIILEKFKD